jgi:hypothetical protein
MTSNVNCMDFQDQQELSRKFLTPSQEIEQMQLVLILQNLSFSNAFESIFGNQYLIAWLSTPSVGNNHSLLELKSSQIDFSKLYTSH